MVATFRKIYDLLDRRERRNALLLLSILLFQGLLEAAGVASIIPFMAVLADPDLIQRNSWLASVYRGLGFANQLSFLIFLAVAALVVTLARIGGTALSSYATTRYALLRGFTLSSRLIESYLSRPYCWFLNRHSADMGKAVLSEVEEVVKGSLMRAFDLIAAVVVASSLICVVILAEPWVAISAGLVVAAAYGLIYFALRPIISRLGSDRLIANRQRFQVAQEMLSGVKEVKIHGLESPFIRRFSDVAHRFARLKARHAVLSQMPRHFLEALVVAGTMTIVLLLLVNVKGDFSRALPLLGLYAFAALRLMPTMQRIYSDLVSLRFGSAALDALHADLTDTSVPILPGKSKKRMAFTACLELRNVTFTYPRAERPALLNTSITIVAKSSVGFVGKTGAGKTTLVDLIIGLFEPDKGELTVDGLPITRENVREWQRAIGYVPQHVFLIDDTVAANVAFGVAPSDIDMHAVERACRMAALHDFIVELPQGYATKVGDRGVRLSGGQRQRISIARALYHDPDVLVLDEATSALDNDTEAAIMDAVRNLAHRKTVLIVAHRLSTVRGCDQIFLVEHGVVKTKGSYDELLMSDQSFRQLAALAKDHAGLDVARVSEE